MSNGVAEASAAALPGGGAAPRVTLRTLAPLPLFRIPFPIPSSDQPISAVKLTVLGLLGGQISPKSSTQAAAAAMTYSERLKQETLQAWRMDMITLELRQNAVIAPETREGEAADAELMGFELADDHECALLEEGDEIVIRIKAPHNLDSLRLPALPRGHVYGLPAGSLTRAGTLSAPPPYSVQRPREPSSHSSSVAGQPEANFHAHVYRDPARGFRVISTAEASGGAAAAARPTRPRLGPQKSSAAAAGPVPGSYRAPAVAAVAPPPHKRRNSRSQPSSPALEQSPQPNGGAGSRTPGSGTNGIFASAQAAAPPPHKRHVSSGSGESLTRNNGGPSTPISLNGGGATMPLTALVIGPGVQGRYGAALAEPAAGAGAEYGNAAAFSAFTAAGGEMNRPKPKKRTSTRLPSKSGEGGEREGKAKAAADAAERRAATNGEAAVASHPPSAFPAAAGKERPKQSRKLSTSSSRVELPTPPILPPIRNLAPFAPAPVIEKLAAMPSASTSPTVRADGTTYVTSTPDDQLAADAALALSLASSEYADATSSRSASIATSKAQSSSAAAVPAVASTSATPVAPTEETPKPSKADKRYAAIQAELARERARQAEAERVRALEAHNREARKAEEARKRAEEEKAKKVKEQWLLWEEVRRREKKAGLPPPAVVSLLDNADEAKGTDGAA